MSENNGQKETSIAHWGSRNEVREIVQRINAMRMSLPGGQRLDDTAIRTLAQASVAHGLNPLNGEIWIIPGSGLMVGIKGLCKHAKRQLHEGGKAGNMWTEFVEITDPDTLKRWRITGDALVFECRLYDTESIELYVRTIERFKDLGMPWETTTELVGSRPYTTGIGVLRANEKTKMEPVQCARNRAEADAIKRRFDVEFGPGTQEADEEPDAYSGDWAVDGESELVEDPETEDQRTAESPADRDAQFGVKESDTDPVRSAMDAIIPPAPEPFPATLTDFALAAYDAWPDVYPNQAAVTLALKNAGHETWGAAKNNWETVWSAPAEFAASLQVSAE